MNNTKVKIGQINKNTFLGKYLYEFSMRKDINNIIDIGTWNGFGSTKCIIDGIVDSNKIDYNFFTIECNYDKHLEAKINLSNFNNFKNINLLYGRITNIEDLINLEDYDESFFATYSREIQNKWYDIAIEEHMTTPYLYNNLLQNISHIDMLVLDGGEYCTYGEFIKLNKISKFIFLDDTKTIKNYKVAEIIRNSKSYSIIQDNLQERQGFLIAENLEFKK